MSWLWPVLLRELARGHPVTVEGLARVSGAASSRCALDTLIFLTVLAHPAHVLSPSPGSGEQISLSVDPAAAVTETAWNLRGRRP